MSKLICTAAIDGALHWIARAEQCLDAAIAAKGATHAAAFPDTAYALPIIYGLSGAKVRTLAECRETLRQAKRLVPERPAAECWLPYLGGALDAGVAALFACEIIEACKYALGPAPAKGIWLGAASDVIMRERGVEFVDGTAPGFAAITGAAPSVEIAVKIARELQEKNIYVFMAGASPLHGKDVQFAEQLAAAGVQLGWETRLVPFGPDVSALVYALGFASRVAMAFGGVKPGQARANLLYNKNRVFAFVLALGEVTAAKYAVAAGAINYGFPVLADTDIPEILPTGVCTYEHVVANVPHASMVERGLEIRGCKIKITKVPVPVSYGAAFEGEIIRKPDVQVEFGGNKTTAFEFVTSVDLDQIADHEIELIGPDIDTVPVGSALPLSIWVEVAGRKMQADFEPVLERQLHHFINGAEGVWHMGQRDIVWTRVSKNAFQRGFRLKHYGEIVHAKLLADYPAIVDKVKVTLITDAEEVARRVTYARTVYDQRNRRLASMTDESVDLFYSCLLCQSFAPNHVCVITPERSGLCGAYNWLDGKAAFEIDNTGPNQPVPKGVCLDAVKGVWQGVNDYTYANSHKAIERVCAYSIMDSPMTSCGCFEAICGYVPECNGVMALPREFSGDTPVGMRFSTLAGNVGGGQQTPGFVGCSKAYFASKKFLSAEGAQRRLVWMPKQLKEFLRSDLEKRFEELGLPGFLDRVADETIATDPAEIRAFLERVDHPALQMQQMEDYAEAAPTAVAPAVAPAESAPAAAPASVQALAPLSSDLAALKGEILRELKAELKAEVGRELVSEIIDSLRVKFLGQTPLAPTPVAVTPVEDAAPSASAPEPASPSATARLARVTSFPLRRETAEQPVHRVTLGATAANGGTRGKAYTLGGATAMPFHNYEAAPGGRPLIAMDVFDRVDEKYPEVLREIYGELLADPAAMAAACVGRFGADLINVRLDSTHPERGGRSPAAAVELVGRVLKAVDVPLIVTGPAHFETANEVLKEIAKAYTGENLLLNWVEQENYRTIAGAAIAYGHCVVAQSPIDVNIAKQLNILLGNMDLGLDRVVVDPNTGGLGYGLEYTYSVMERIRLTGLSGDAPLASPMFVTPGPECSKLKEYKALEKNYPAWGERNRRALHWELATATALLYAGADILVMHHPEAAMELKRLIGELME